MTLFRQFLLTAALAGSVWGIATGLGRAGLLPARFERAELWLRACLADNQSSQAGPDVRPSIAESVSEPMTAGPPALLLPPKFYGVAGEAMQITYDNLVLTARSVDYQFSIGSEAAVRLTGTTRSCDLLAPAAGEYPLTATLSDANGHVLSRASSRLLVAAPDAGAGRPLRMLIAGDSNTHRTTWVNDLAALLSQSGNPQWSMLGDVPAHAAKGVRHEGLQGWSLIKFATYYHPEARGSVLHNRSPFLYAGPDGRPRLDFARYYLEKCDGRAPDVFVLQVGVTDVWGGHAHRDQAQEVTDSIACAEALVKAVHEADPRTAVALLLPPPPSASDKTFDASFGEWFAEHGRSTGNMRWDTRRGQHALASALIEHFKDREGDGVWLLPLYASIDPVRDYATDDAVHPNEAGCQEMARCVYAWLKCWMSRPRP
jgi:lysophospholipase L1-like esterase